jgi:UPF0716 protein FxsA
MCGVLALVFIATTAAEIGLLIQVGSLIGGLATFGVVVATGVAGAALARHQGAAALARLRQSLETGDPTVALVDGALVLAAAVTLLAPGFITDTAGLLLLVPAIRAPVARRLHRVLAARALSHIDLTVRRRAAGHDHEDPPPPGVIDV